jgi:hypothetical protein
MKQLICKISVRDTDAGRKFGITSPRTGNTVEVSRRFLDTLPDIRRKIDGSKIGWATFALEELRLFHDAAQREAFNARMDAAKVEGDRRAAAERMADPAYQDRLAVAFDQSRRLSFRMARRASHA